MAVIAPFLAATLADDCPEVELTAAERVAIVHELEQHHTGTRAGLGSDRPPATSAPRIDHALCGPAVREGPVPPEITAVVD